MWSRCGSCRHAISGRAWCCRIQHLTQDGPARTVTSQRSLHFLWLAQLRSRWPIRCCFGGVVTYGSCLQISALLRSSPAHCSLDGILRQVIPATAGSMQPPRHEVQRISCIENNKPERKGEWNASTFSSALPTSSWPPCVALYNVGGRNTGKPT